MLYVIAMKDKTVYWLRADRMALAADQINFTPQNILADGNWQDGEVYFPAVDVETQQSYADAELALTTYNNLMAQGYTAAPVMTPPPGSEGGAMVWILSDKVGNAYFRRADRIDIESDLDVTAQNLDAGGTWLPSASNAWPAGTIEKSGLGVSDAETALRRYDELLAAGYQADTFFGQS